jgi:hypothetical protein
MVRSLPMVTTARAPITRCSKPLVISDSASVKGQPANRHGAEFRYQYLAISGHDEAVFNIALAEELDYQVIARADAIIRRYRYALHRRKGARRAAEDVVAELLKLVLEALLLRTLFQRGCSLSLPCSCFQA